MNSTEKRDLIKRLADELGLIAILWNIEDVKSIRPDLTDEQAHEVLDAVENKHDANHGINWHVIEAHADFLFPPAAAQKEGAG